MTEAEEILLARVSDFLERARRGEITYTRFLTPGEQRLLTRCGGWMPEEAFPWGGYEAAERKRIFFLPPYLSALEEPYRTECLAEPLADCLLALEVKGSGYRELTHRDFLGALLHLGVERDCIGDICVTAPDRAILFCDRLMADFFSRNLERVANDAVRLSVVSLPPRF